MKIIKPYLALIALVLLCQIVNGQRIRGITYNPIKGPFAYETVRYKNVVTVPFVFFDNADTGSISFRNNKFYGKKVVDGIELWVPLVDSTTSVSSDVTDIYQRINNASGTIGDTTTVLVLNQDAPNTANRVITLKSAATFSGKTLKILNYNFGSYLNTVTPAIKYYDNSELTSLTNSATYVLSSDGSYWRLVSETKFIEGGSSTGGSSGVDLINLD